jgi:hypothetical protein
MQADCFNEYLRCIQANVIGAPAPDIVCTATLITCMNVHLYSSLGEHLVDRPGEADVTGKSFLEATLVAKVLERHDAAAHRYAKRARALGSTALATGQTARDDLERDLDQFVQLVLQDLQHRHHSD